MALTAEGIKQYVISRYHEGQDITLWLASGERGQIRAGKYKILKFNPFGVLVESNGIKQTFTFWEIKTYSSKPSDRKEIIIPNTLKNLGRERSYKINNAY